ncbi:RNA polymerase sigma factor RpoE [Lachnospiraceae bacterium TWA4]|nr:RNA polymerase sigma factor RpoE [Lachnospiraceae bacterium TWA4]
MLSSRDEGSIVEIESNYKNYCEKVIRNILGCNEDVEECLNDTWLKAWNSIPPNRPSNLATYLGKLARNTAIDYLRKSTRLQRGGTDYEVALQELQETLPSSKSVEAEIDEKELTNSINQFLKTISSVDRNIFICRYWYVESIDCIAKMSGFSKSKIKSNLFRTRKKLKKYLEKEGYSIG